MKKTQRTLAWLLVAVMAASSLAACSGGDDPADTTADTTASTTTVETTTEDPLADDLPEKKWEGKEFRICNSENDTEYIEYFLREEQNGETLNDAIYTANENVMTRFDMKLVSSKVPGNHMGGIRDALINTQMAGDNAWEYAVMHDIQSVNVMLAGVVKNVLELPHLNLEKPWWPKYTTEALTVNGKMYHIANASGYYGLFSTRALFFNKGMMEDMGIEYPYQDVLNGTWYFDDLLNMTKDVYSDLDNDAARSIGDRYGIAITGATYAFLEGFGIDVYGHDEKGFLTDNFYTDRNVAIIEKINQLFYGGNVGGYHGSHTGYFDANSSLTMFAGGNVLFSMNSIGRHVQACMESDIDYGLVPMPKIDEAQEDYYGGCVDEPGLVPINNTADEFTGMIIEAMAAEGYRLIQPAYSETVLKGRYATDPESAAMMDILFNNRLLAAGYLYSNSMRLQIVQDTILNQKSSNTNIASYYEANKGKFQADIDRANEFFAREAE